MARDNSDTTPRHYGRPPLDRDLRSARVIVTITERELALIDWEAGPGGRSGWVYDRIRPYLEELNAQAIHASESGEADGEQ